MTGKRPRRLLRDAVTKFFAETDFRNDDSRRSAWKFMDPIVGDLPLTQVNDDALAPLVAAYRQKARRCGTINNAIDLISAVLGRAANRWRNENGTTWISVKPRLTRVLVIDRTPPYPITWEEEDLLLSFLSPNHQDIVRFALNTGLRDKELRSLRWDWERGIEGTDDIVFALPGHICKNRRPRLLILNSIAREIVERQRNQHKDVVFVSGRYRSPWTTSFMGNFLKYTRMAALAVYKERLGKLTPDGFATVRFHDLRHTFGHRLTCAGVPRDQIGELLGHSNRTTSSKLGWITGHYCSADYFTLRAAVEKLCDPNFRKIPTIPTLRLIRAR
jgi:integrase